MWGFLFTYVEGLLASPYRPPPGKSGAAGLVGWGLVALVLVGILLRSPPLALIPVVFSTFVLASIGEAYRSLERARDDRLADPREPPTEPKYLSFAFPTAAALFALASAVDAARRGEMKRADDLSRFIERDALRSQEIRLLEGLRALVTLELGDHGRAAQRALAALPTGCEDVDVRLGRLAIKGAWANEVRLGKIDDAWSEAGVLREGEGSLSRLRRLVEIRLVEEGQTSEKIAALAPPEKRPLAEEARLVGDEELARSLEADLGPQRHGYR
jgi:hypothetical protein